MITKTIKKSVKKINPEAKQIKELKNEIKAIKKSRKNIINTYVKIPLIGIIIFAVLFVILLISLFVTSSNNKNGTKSIATSNVFDAENVDKPELDFYVMSFCPYGNQIETIIRPIFDLLGNYINFKPKYIFSKVTGDLATYCKSTSPSDTNCSDYVTNGYFEDIAACKKEINSVVKECNDESKYLKIGDNLYTSLHGRVEANQDVREICAYNLTEDKKLWWDFIENVNTNCTSTNADTCWEEQATKAGLDTNKITECFNKDAGALIEAEIADTTKYNVTGSPTLLIGDQTFPPTVDSTSTDQNIKIGKEVFSLDDTRTSNVIKAALCTAFDKSPKECGVEIESTETDAASSTGGC